MRILRLAPLALVALTACDTGLSTYYRPGVSVSRMQTETTRCEVAALKDAPVANQVRQRPPIFYPGTQYCNSAGCYYRPGYWVDGGFYTEDVNRGLRARVLDLCMAEKGFQPVSLPACSAAVTAAAPMQATRTLPQLTSASCVIRYDDGSWQVVNPVTPIASE
ncbi:hypothetical protein [Sedimentitalea arenosa]|uniref:Lipoprotein n=1 Tax=Sedimentitalea arenosa TaxID=2798803 RepID=A0A8J7LR39_9RHOB|nr:hypothetical protein [Arenibacterium arenosum]MBJ6371563.1 hypothetical protein [Arenibacterium arenosum]